MLMPEQRHTAGAWRLEYDAQGPCMIMHPTRKGVAIASLSGTFKPANGFYEERGDNWPEERNANAYVLVAAPELLTAAELILASHYEGHVEMCGCEGFDELAEAVRLAKGKSDDDDDPD